MPDPRPTPIPATLDLRSIPHHVGVVMDGNGRWATRRGLPRTEGHGAGEEALVDTAYGALAIGVKALTVYAFSTENWRRPIDEVRYLMNFNRGLLERRQHELHAQGRAHHLLGASRLARAAQRALTHGRGRGAHQGQ